PELPDKLLEIGSRERLVLGDLNQRLWSLAVMAGQIYHHAETILPARRKPNHTLNPTDLLGFSIAFFSQTGRRTEGSRPPAAPQRVTFATWTAGASTRHLAGAPRPRQPPPGAATRPPA